VEFQAKPRNLPQAAKFTHFNGISLTMSLQNQVATDSKSSSPLLMMPNDVLMTQTQSEVAKPLEIMMPGCQPHVVFQPLEQGPGLFII
jgi:hypothetical protein